MPSRQPSPSSLPASTPGPTPPVTKPSCALAELRERAKAATLRTRDLHDELLRVVDKSSAAYSHCDAVTRAHDLIKEKIPDTESLCTRLLAARDSAAYTYAQAQLVTNAARQAHKVAQAEEAAADRELEHAEYVHRREVRQARKAAAKAIPSATVDLTSVAESL